MLAIEVHWRLIVVSDRLRRVRVFAWIDVKDRSKLELLLYDVTSA